MDGALSWGNCAWVTCLLKLISLAGNHSCIHINTTCVLSGTLGEYGDETPVSWAHPNCPPAVLVTAGCLHTKPTAYSVHGTVHGVRACAKTL